MEKSWKDMNLVEWFRANDSRPATLSFGLIFAFIALYCGWGAYVGFAKPLAIDNFLIDLLRPVFGDSWEQVQTKLVTERERYTYLLKLRTLEFLAFEMLICAALMGVSPFWDILVVPKFKGDPVKAVEDTLVFMNTPEEKGLTSCLKIGFLQCSPCRKANYFRVVFTHHAWAIIL
jgi:hypothetical protein